MLKFICLFASFLFAGFIGFVCWKTKLLKFAFIYDLIEFFTLRIYGGNRAVRKWKKLKRSLAALSEENPAFITIKAHDILDKLLERLVPVYHAENFSTRLAYIGNHTFSNTEDIWWAHELYRSIQRGEQLVLSRDDLDKLVKTYDQALKDLNLKVN